MKTKLVAALLLSFAVVGDAAARDSNYNPNAGGNGNGNGASNSNCNSAHHQSCGGSSAYSAPAPIVGGGAAALVAAGIMVGFRRRLQRQG